MTSFSIEAQIRAKDENCKHLRKQKKLPWIVYGKNQEPISLTLDSSEFLKLFRKTGESSIIDLKVGKKEIEVLVHDYQKQPVSGEFMHVDFFALTRWEKLTTKVSLNFVWESSAVKQWAILEELQKEVEISCLPRHLVKEIDVDLSLLKEMDNNIKISDINVPEWITITNQEDEVIAIASKPKVEKIEDDIETIGEESQEEKTEQKDDEKDTKK